MSADSAERQAIAAELRELNVDPATVMEKWTGAAPALDDALVEDGALVLPAELEPSVKGFTAAATQWRWVSFGFAKPLRVGLDYAGLRAALALEGIAETPELFGDIRIMEAAALAALSEGADR